MSICNIENIGENCNFLDYLHPGGKDLSLWIANQVGLSVDMNMLDIGCGHGTTVCIYKKEFGCNITGIDINEKMIESSIKRAVSMNLSSQVEFKKGDALSLEFEDNTFDFVLNEGALTLCCDPQKAIKEMVRVTKPGARIAFIEIIAGDNVNAEEKIKLNDCLGIEELRTAKEWIDIVNKCNVSNIKTSYLWGLESLYKMRLNWNKKKLYTFGEKVILFKEVLKNSSIKELFRLMKVEKKFLQAYKNEIVGTITVIAEV